MTDEEVVSDGQCSTNCPPGPMVMRNIKLINIIVTILN